VQAIRTDRRRGNATHPVQPTSTLAGRSLVGPAQLGRRAIVDEDVVDLNFEPLTPERWNDLARLFGPRGAVGGCWCMWWRITRREFDRRTPAEKRTALRRLIRNDRAHGVLGYASDHPIGWCAVGPRDEFPVLDRSRLLRPVDDAPVWSITCFFIAKEWKGAGVAHGLLDAAIALARRNGASLVEGYPVDPGKDSTPDTEAFTGFRSMFEKAGFVEVARRSATRPVMRKEITH
jgi:GNAT superfamily N-acetyltransferase